VINIGKKKSNPKRKKSKKGSEEMGGRLIESKNGCSGTLKLGGEIVVAVKEK